MDSPSRSLIASHKGISTPIHGNLEALSLRRKAAHGGP